jgi:hypothetical protein
MLASKKMIIIWCIQKNWGGNGLRLEIPSKTTKVVVQDSGCCGRDFEPSGHVIAVAAYRDD